MGSHRDSVSITILSPRHNSLFSRRHGGSLASPRRRGAARRRINQGHVRRRRRTEPRNHVTIDISLHLRALSWGTSNQPRMDMGEPLPIYAASVHSVCTYICNPVWRHMESRKGASSGIRFRPGLESTLLCRPVKQVSRLATRR